MPLPAILGAAAAIAGATGGGSPIHGGVKMKKANDTMKKAQTEHQENIARFELQNKRATTAMDRLGKQELEILQSFEKFTSIFERIQNKPEFKSYRKGDVEIPAYNPEDLKEVSVGAGVLLGGLGGAALGTAGGFAAAGATTAAVMAFGTASTGTAIASLSGAAAPNGTLAATRAFWQLLVAERWPLGEVVLHLGPPFLVLRHWAWESLSEGLFSV